MQSKNWKCDGCGCDDDSFESSSVGFCESCNSEILQIMDKLEKLDPKQDWWIIVSTNYGSLDDETKDQLYDDMAAGDMQPWLGFFLSRK